jgi:hypothetical protein
MALSFPLAQASFISLWRWSEFNFDLEIYESISGTRGGEQLSAEIAEPKWRLDVLLKNQCLTGSADLGALIHAMRKRGSDGTFLARDLRRKGPREDYNGLGLSGYTPTILSISGRTALRLAGLPDGYVLSRGDVIGVTYGSNPVRYGYMTMAEGITANGAGQTAYFEVNPFVKSGITAGMAVDLVNVPVKMQIRSYDPGVSVRRATTGVRLSAIEAF